MQPSVSSSSVAAATGRIQTCIGCIREYDEKSMKTIVSAADGTAQKDTWMCIFCKRLRERIQKVVTSGECEEMTYENKEEKAEFFLQAHALMGTELKMKMKDHITKQNIKHSSWNFKGNGDWLDEQGLEDKYKNHKDKDFIIKNIKDHANTMTHPTKKN